MNRPFAPNFLKRYDDYLLKNKPELYSTRFHWVLYYGIVAITFLVIIFAIIPNDARSNSPIFIHTCFVVIAAIIGFVVWLIFLLRFNVFKRFGNVTAIGRLSVFWLYFLCTFIIVLSCFVPSVVETFRANATFKEKDLVADLNAINVGICKLEYDSLKQDWDREIYRATDYWKSKKDTVITLNEAIRKEMNYEIDVTVATSVVDSAPKVILPNEDDDDAERINHYPFYNILIKTLNSDSTVKVNDSTFVFYTCPSYKKVSARRYGSNLEDSAYSSKDLYHQIFQHPIQIDRLKEWQTLKPLLEKYSFEYGSLHTYKPPVFEYYDTIYHNRLEKRYNINTLENNFSNILERKYRYSDTDTLHLVLRLIYYPSLIFSLLLFVFRHSTTKTFFLSILTGILLLIVAAIITAFSSYGNSDATGFGIMILYLLLFLVVSITCFNATNRNAVQGIAINSFTWMIYFLPLIIVAFYYSNVNEPYSDKAADVFRENRLINFIIAEITCPILFSILLVSFIYKLYRRWFALPQE